MFTPEVQLGKIILLTSLKLVVRAEGEKRVKKNYLRVTYKVFHVKSVESDFLCCAGTFNT